MSFLPLKRPALSRPAFLLLFSFYIAVFLNFAFYRQVLAVMPLTTPHSVFVFLSMPVVAFSVINIVVTLLSFVWLDRVAIALFILVSAAAQFFILNYGIVLDRSMIVNMLNTTASETLALMTPQLLFSLLVFGMLMIALVFLIRIKTGNYTGKSIIYRAASVLVSAALICLVALLFYKDYASLFRNNKELVKALNPSNSIAASWSYYSHHRLANQPLVRIGEDARQNPQMLSGAKKNLTILIVGETSRADDFSLSGYSRVTNPLLAKDDVVWFPNTVSCGTSTAVSVPCMFSNMHRSHYDDVLASHQEGLLDILQRAGISVLWNENDGGCKGACDRVPHQDMTSLNLPGMCIKGECYDDVLFHGIEDYIKQLKGNGVIVLHTIGSHGPTYYNRYPPQFRKFVPTCDTNQIQTCTNEQLVNTYDNTILYVDYIVDKAIGILKAQQDNFTTSLVYLSDHGESLGENGVYLHGMPYAIAPMEQKKVPMLLWLSADYQKRYSVDATCLRKMTASQNYSQDNLFSTMLGITGTETREYVPSDDILTACRSKS
ncbi:phosphoethanolamine transferase EptA [Enterobacteriaceae bacterium H20N1]|uniref:Phosphoethanolamine transferase EptA n=1 Tax=Dryocola boscaweniae TaxID=2925397 RepID=A0A9X2W9Z4_9ENTR|nr:phosphoethanolamine transferase EptA [Dryocola boscaweniae]MCT4703838.1 phosphoethanolamine transferase EptA [Dryocola boscaweniae]MCT4721006.1 phosphoethanolamine transferase EptA [Dryocola boscaweniae]